MRQLFYLALGFTFMLMACGGNEVPECIDNQLQSFRSEACPTTATELGGNLAEFRFKAQTVYCFNYGFCDPSRSVEIFTEDCVLLCELGGPDGNTVCDNVEWIVGETAIEQDVIFQR